MDIQKLQYSPRTGWLDELPHDLDSPDTLLLLFATPQTLAAQPDLPASLKTGFPQATLLGASTFAPIADGRVVEDGAVLAVLRFEQTGVRPYFQPNISPANSYATGQALGKALYGDDLRLIVLFANDRAVNDDELMRGINDALPHPVLISGGMASHDDYTGGQRFLIWNGQTHENALVAAGLYGPDLLVQQAEDVGLEEVMRSEFHTITGVQGRRVTEVDGRPALHVYKEFLGQLADRPDIIHVFPIGFYENRQATLRVVRSVLEVDEAEQALVFASEPPAERTIRFMVGLPSQFIDAAESVTRRVSEAFVARPAQLALMVSCASRHFVLGERAAKEAANAFAALPNDTQQIGLYAYGEIAPGGSGYCELHNHTINMLLLGER
jgi:hypothetical protein